MAGSKLANDLLQTPNTHYSITLIGEESQVGYNRIMLSSLLANDISDAEMPLVNTDKMRVGGVHIISGDPVICMDLETKELCFGSGQSVTYDQLVFATGSRGQDATDRGASAQNVMGFSYLARC